MKTILLTGSSGFVGGAVLEAVQKRGMPVRTVCRSPEQAKCFSDGESGAVVISTLGADTDWSAALSGIDVVLHCAARVHVMQDSAIDPLAEFRKVNVDATVNLARQAAQAGVRRFVFVSSIGVNGNATDGIPFGVTDTLAPHSGYAISKAGAELGLRQLAIETGMEVTIVRPPLVYGPNAPGNMRSMMQALRKRLPLPLGCVTKNRRSLVALDNLVDLLLTCIDHPAAANQTFLVSDGEDISTVDLLRRLGAAMGYPARLVPVPTPVLWAGAYLLGKRDMAQQLLGSLQVDIEHTRHTLGWTPPVSVDEGLRRAAGKRL